MSTLTTTPDIRTTRGYQLRWIILALVLAADVLDLIDSSITNIAAPTIARELHGGHGLIQWLSAGYSLALGVLLVVGARLGDRFGQRRMFLVGVVGFTLASLACGLAWSPESIIRGFSQRKGPRKESTARLVICSERTYTDVQMRCEILPRIVRVPWYFDRAREVRDG